MVLGLFGMTVLGSLCDFPETCQLTLRRTAYVQCPVASEWVPHWSDVPKRKEVKRKWGLGSILDHIPKPSTKTQYTSTFSERMGFGPGIPSRTTPWYIQELFKSDAYPNQPLKPLELQLAPAFRLHQHLLNLWYLWHFPLIVPEPMMLRHWKSSESPTAPN